MKSLNALLDKPWGDVLEAPQKKAEREAIEAKRKNFDAEWAVTMAAMKAAKSPPPPAPPAAPPPAPKPPAAPRRAAAAGTTKGRAPLPATIFVPDFMRLEAHELHQLLNCLRDPLAVHLYMLLLVQMQYTSGEFLSSYARLMELMTPPSPKHGKSKPGPSYKQVRTALDTLIVAGLVGRGTQNAAQGELRLHLEKRAKAPPRPHPKDAPQTPPKGPQNRESV